MTDLAVCSCCGKRQDQVKQLVASGNGAFMCDECVALSYEIMVEEGALPPLMTNQEP